MHHVPSDPASLERLHDIVEPAAVSLFWPPAPGWWVVLGLCFIVVTITVWKALHRYSRNAYRRYALRLLGNAGDAHAVNVILKRVALATYPRHEVARLAGKAWTEWLSAHGPDSVSGDSARVLTSGLHQPMDGELDSLRRFARQWIVDHREGPQW